MSQNTSTTDDAQPCKFAHEIAQQDLSSGRLAIPSDESRVIVHVMPGSLEEIDELAAGHGLKRVDGEMDRRTYKPDDD